MPRGCEDGFPSWAKPWTWGDYYVYPEATFIGFAGLLAASAFIYLVVVARQRSAIVTFALSLALLSYPFFAGLTSEGRWTLMFGPLLGVIALASRSRVTSVA